MKIFITREVKDNSPLMNLKDKVDIVGQSLLRITPVPFHILPKSDWVFFYSANGVRHLVEGVFNHNVYLNSLKIGVMGDGTAKVLEELTGQKADFIGSGKSEDAVAFYKDLSETILFIKGKNSLESVERQLDPTKVEELIVYDNVINTEVEIPEADIYIMTSPLNVEAYMTNAFCKFNTKIIAIGETTNAKLVEKGFLQASVPNTPTEEAIVSLLKDMI